jgi:hypothetical protein
MHKAWLGGDEVLTVIVVDFKAVTHAFQFRRVVHWEFCGQVLIKVAMTER